MPGMRARVTEHDEQVALFQWAATALKMMPEVGLLHAIPNGGHRHPAVAKRLKAEGVKRGVPDLCLPIPRGPYHGMYIEMKAGENKPTAEQLAWFSALSALGYYTALCYSAERAIEEITFYLGLS
jgi:hypothetical protein